VTDGKRLSITSLPLDVLMELAEEVAGGEALPPRLAQVVEWSHRSESAVDRPWTATLVRAARLFLMAMSFADPRDHVHQAFACGAIPKAEARLATSLLDMYFGLAEPQSCVGTAGAIGLGDSPPGGAGSQLHTGAPRTGGAPTRLGDLLNPGRGSGGRPPDTTKWSREKFCADVTRAYYDWIKYQGVPPTQLELAVQLNIPMSSFWRYLQKWLEWPPRRPAVSE